MNENIFRISSALILFTCIGISFYHRRKADKDSGEKISRKLDEILAFIAIAIRVPKDKPNLIENLAMGTINYREILPKK